MANNRNNTPKKKATSEYPHNSQAERAVLGSALLSKDALFTILSMLKEDDFYEVRHRVIYRALFNASYKKTAVDVLTIAEELNNIKELENIGGSDYLQQCVDSMVALSSLDFYIHIVSDQSVLRKLLQSIREIDRRYHEEEIEDVDGFIEQSEAMIKEATSKRRISDFKSTEDIAKIVQREIDDTKELQETEESITGLTTGFEKLNFLTQGFHREEMIIVAARPSVGKTALALNIAFRAATLADAPVALFSLEMSSELLIKRMLASDSTVDLKKISNPKTLSANDRLMVAKSVRRLSQAPIFIDDSSGNKLMDIIAKSRKLQAKLQANQKELGLIIVDYLGLIGSSNTRGNDSRQEEVRKTSLALKDLARELKVPVVVVSQLSREVEKRENKRPMLSDLRESGSIEQDADVVMLLYREDYYKGSKMTSEDIGSRKMKNLSDSEKSNMAIEARKRQLSEQAGGNASYVEVNVAKNRNGQTGVCGLFFYKAYGRFDDPPAEFEEEMRQLRRDSGE